MINLSLIILSSNVGSSIDDGVEMILSNEENLDEVIKNIKTSVKKYHCNLKENTLWI